MIPVFNTTGETIPAGGLMEPIHEVDTSGRVKVQKPTADSTLGILVNGPTPIASETAGSGFLPWYWPLQVAIDSDELNEDGELVEAVERVGSKAGSWFAHAKKTGFFVQADPLLGLLPVQAEAASTSCCDDDDGGEDSFPLNPMPCLVTGEDGPTGLAQIWFNPETGEGECRTTGACGTCPPDEPEAPDPATSCCSLWYCTPDGPVEVTADGDGKYTPPGDWNGSEPHLTEEEALEACPIPTPEMPTCADVPHGDLDYVFEGGSCAGMGTLDGYTGTITYGAGSPPPGVDQWYDGGGGPCGSDGGVVMLRCEDDVWAAATNSAGGACALALTSWTATSLTFTAPAGPCGSWVTGPFTLTIAW